jgi:L-ascorbate metabolism protein UlaG (beta-lactamase superfamily)
VVLIGGFMAFALTQNRGEAPASSGGVGPLAVGNLPAAPTTVPSTGNAPAANGPAINAPAPGNKPMAPLRESGKVATTRPTAPPIKRKVDPNELPADHPPITNDEGSQVGIQWLGHSCFYIHSPGGIAAVTDPFDPKATGLPAPSTGAHFVTVSGTSPTSSFVQAVKPFMDEATLKPLALDVVRSEPAGKDDLKIQPVETSSGRIYLIQAGALRIAHLGGVRQALSAAQIQALGKVDVLMIPVGEGLTPKQAVEIARALKPSIILPMAYSTPDMDGPEARLRRVEQFIAASPFAVTRKDSDVMLIAPSELPANTEIYLLRLRS